MQDKSAKKTLALLIGLYTFVFSTLTIVRHQRLGSGTFDLGIFDQALYLVARSDSSFLTSRGLHLNADHFHPILYLLAPAYLVWPSVNLLLILQSLILGLGAYPAYRLARHYRLEERWSLVVAAAYLVHPTVSFLNRFEFHPVCFMVPALMFSVLFLEEARPWPFSLSVVAALASTEAAGFTIIAMAVTALWVRDKRWFAGTFALGVLGIVAAKAWLGYFNQHQSSPYAILYTEYGKSEVEVALHMLTQPLDTLARLSTPVNWEYLFYLVGPLVFLPLLAPDRLLPAVPALLGNLLSWRESQHRVEYHYGAALTPFLLWAAVIGWDRLRRRGVKDKTMGGLLGLACLLSVIFGPLGFKHMSRLPEGATIANALSQVKPDEIAVVDNGLGAHFSQRENFYLFPNPFVVLAWGNTPQALIQQASSEYRPLSRGSVRRGMESTRFDAVVLPVDVDRMSPFPLRAGDSLVIRREVRRHLQPVGPVSGDAVVLRKKP